MAAAPTSLSVMTCIFFPVETPGQAEPEHPLLLFFLHTHPVTEQPTTQGPWLIKACLREDCAGLRLLFLKLQEKPSICHINSHCTTLYPWLHPKSGIYNRVLLCLWTSITFPEGKQQAGSGSMMPDWMPLGSIVQPYWHALLWSSHCGLSNRHL